MGARSWNRAAPAQRRAAKKATERRRGWSGVLNVRRADSVSALIERTIDVLNLLLRCLGCPAFVRLHLSRHGHVAESPPGRLAVSDSRDPLRAKCEHLVAQRG